MVLFITKYSWNIPVLLESLVELTILVTVVTGSLSLCRLPGSLPLTVVCPLVCCLCVICLSTCLLVFMCICLPALLSVGLPALLSVGLSVICPSVWMSISSPVCTALLNVQCLTMHPEDSNIYDTAEATMQTFTEKPALMSQALLQAQKGRCAKSILYPVLYFCVCRCVHLCACVCTCVHLCACVYVLLCTLSPPSCCGVRSLYWGQYNIYRRSVNVWDCWMLEDSIATPF